MNEGTRQVLDYYAGRGERTDAVQGSAGGQLETPAVLMRTGRPEPYELYVYFAGQWHHAGRYPVNHPAVQEMAEKGLIEDQGKSASTIDWERKRQEHDERIEQAKAMTRTANKDDHNAAIRKKLMGNPPGHIRRALEAQLQD